MNAYQSDAGECDVFGCHEEATCEYGTERFCSVHALKLECGRLHGDMAYGFWLAAQIQDTSTPKCSAHGLRISFARGTCPFKCVGY